MNKAMISLLGFGAGVAASAWAGRSSMLNQRQIRKLRKQVRKLF
ncbi:MULTISPECIES: YrzQ family protein [Bacillus]|jgi:hypothetical protein|uniref:DUF3918 domain-containing protein n=1 Tax=Bacillus smithii 7_3_47FAA TaxID=665952 RepID=G9QQ05_9BACI|nr:YrzQ family protein [Bacillus smithii]AKP47915.1 hypothetical protein BSM4216_2680 [Bacillus smithii]EHL73319.1 hypothetical protein HMPREF1015_00372 [Bacillus smithii 7_3_47FAA]MED0659069.1 YrzQ family protein [Bacillus smithii]MED1418755.1 YrzQ family protein [Bacillus smithii]MED1455010.1 YrzQ family protein [Bacillus smithii]